MFSVQHNSDNCTIIDCSISEANADWILGEIDKQRNGKGVTRFISTHPDQDHLMGLVALDNHIDILNFYVVNNSATKEDETDDFMRYKMLRDGDKAFNICRDCTRRWMNQTDEQRGSSGIIIHWPITSNKHFKIALEEATSGKSPNNISPVITYSVEYGVKMSWFGDLETDFMEEIKDQISWPSVDILFAPHHGRDSGKIPKSILEEMNPKIVVIGEAPSKNLYYYRNYNTITQNSAGSIYFENVENWVHIYVSNPNYSVDFLVDFSKDREVKTYNNYIGSLVV